jgi:DNA-binding MarR family transcriptional regulator
MTIDGLNKIFDSRIRLGIMSMLLVEDSVDYNTMKENLELTDGNLASHIKALEKEEFIKIVKSFFGKKPHTRYYVTKLGKKAFLAHIDAIENLIKKVK